MFSHHKVRRLAWRDESHSFDKKNLSCCVNCHCLSRISILKISKSTTRLIKGQSTTRCLIFIAKSPHSLFKIFSLSINHGLATSITLSHFKSLNLMHRIDIRLVAGSLLAKLNNAWSGLTTQHFLNDSSEGLLSDHYSFICHIVIRSNVVFIRQFVMLPFCSEPSCNCLKLNGIVQYPMWFHRTSRADTKSL